jgi:uncharacterized membrane protein YjgN (DUF898 family)
MYWLTKLAQNKVLVGMIVAVVMGMVLLPSAGALATSTEEGDFNFGLIYGKDTGLGSQDIRSTISRIINVALSLLGIVAVVIILIGGFEWMTAGGNEEKVGEAKKRILAGVIGLAIILSAYALAKFVLYKLYEATTGSDYAPVESL